MCTIVHVYVAHTYSISRSFPFCVYPHRFGASHAVIWIAFEKQTNKPHTYGLYHNVWLPANSNDDHRILYNVLNNRAECQSLGLYLSFNLNFHSHLSIINAIHSRSPFSVRNVHFVEYLYSIVLRWKVNKNQKVFHKVKRTRFLTIFSGWRCFALYGLIVPGDKQLLCNNNRKNDCMTNNNNLVAAREEAFKLETRIYARCQRKSGRENSLTIRPDWDYTNKFTYECLSHIWMPIHFSP